MSDKIVFKWKEHKYNVQARAYDYAAFIMLPNNKLLRILGWTETKPRQPKLESFDGMLFDYSNVAIAAKN